MRLRMCVLNDIRVFLCRENKLEKEKVYVKIKWFFFFNRKKNNLDWKWFLIIWFFFFLEKKDGMVMLVFI